jgi:hypothetical protein
MVLLGTRGALIQAVKRHFMLALVLTFCMMPLQGATLERLSWNDMMAKSTSIVRGTVTGSRAVFTGRDIHTYYAVQVAETLKGTGQSSIEVVVPGGVANNLRMSYSGAPTLNQGDEYVFFLWSSRAGVTQVLGLTQGLFTVAPDGSKDPLATRRASRELMLDRSSGQPVKDETLVMRMSELRARVSASLKGASQ